MHHSTNLACLLLLLLTQSLSAQFVNLEQVKIGKFQLHPSAESKPALKYSLLPTFLQQREGNAAVHYGKVTAEQINFFSNFELQNTISQMGTIPLDEILKHPQIEMACPDSIYSQLRDAALCEHCNWQIPIKEIPFYEILLPEVQQLRTFARLLQAKARIEIAKGDFDSAIETLQTGYAIAKHAGKGPSYIHVLVGIAVKSIMDAQLECLIQQPDSPNLYWAIATLPQPFFSINRAANIEASILELSFPSFRELTLENINDRTDEYWKKELLKLLEVTETVFFINDERKALTKEELELNLKNIHRRAQLTLVTAGLDQEQIKELSPIKAITLASIHKFHVDNDNLIKWVHLPYHKSHQQIDSAAKELAESERDNILGLANAISPASQQILSALTRQARQTAVLQTLEAIRMHAATNDSNLPDSLDELELPAPNDPVTGKPFINRSVGGSLFITGPKLPARPLKLEISIQRK